MQYPDDEEIAPSTMPPLQGTAAKYKEATLDSFLTYVHSHQYTCQKTYTKAELRTLTSQHVLWWMNLNAFGVIDPQAMRILCLRAVIPWQFEKAISFFMPNCFIPWYSGRNEGNPTRSIEINTLIKRVKKKEVRKQGAASQSRQAITDEDEYRTMQNIFRNQEDRNSLVWRYGLYALTNFQFHLIACIDEDDTTQVLVDNVRVHDNFCNALKTRLNWSKNVTVERDAPWQVVLGSMVSFFILYVDKFGVMDGVESQGEPECFTVAVSCLFQ
jgi:hypothetical protein